jgi:hypothetical protein
MAVQPPAGRSLPWWPDISNALAGNFAAGLWSSSKGAERQAAYGEEPIARLTRDLTAKPGRGFGVVHLSQMKRL